MDVDHSHIQELILRPRESLSVELKRWFDPARPEGMAKIVKTVLALKNHGGGYMVVGFDNETHEPDTENTPDNAKEIFHLDRIQGMISRFSSEPFEVAVEFPERSGKNYPVIFISPGIKTPIVTKSELRGPNNEILISMDTVYIRSLNSNNTPSTTKATWRDWPKILEVCFDNREADIGRFLRRHLGGLAPAALREFASAMTEAMEPEVTTEELLKQLLDKNAERFYSVIRERNVQLPPHGTSEVGLILLGEIPPHSANREFLNLLDASNPDYTGWPVWLDSRGFSDVAARPYVHEGAWEALILNLDSTWGDIEFMRLSPKGKFYLRRALQDDVSHSERHPTPMTALDFGLPILRTAEAIAVGIAFAKAMGCDTEKTRLAFSFRWTKLQGRQLSSWAQASRLMPPGYTAHQDSILSFITVPLNTPLSALDQYVDQAVRPLFEIFDGYTPHRGIVEDLTRRLIERRL